jgi:hypothetical protein
VEGGQLRMPPGHGKAEHRWVVGAKRAHGCEPRVLQSRESRGEDVTHALGIGDS